MAAVHFSPEALNDLEEIKSYIPYQTLINLYLADCVENKKKLNITWA